MNAQNIYFNSITQKMHLFLLIGQSNMAGFGNLAEVPMIQNERIRMFREEEWQQAVEPLHNEHPRDGIGLGMRFAECVANATPDIEIGLIPAAVSGTSINRWIPDGDLYQRALEMAISALKAGTLKAILWLQGENDSANEAAAISHYPKFVQMVRQFRNDLHAENVPFLAATIADFLPKHGEFAFSHLINEGYQQAHDDIAHFHLIDASGLKHCGDFVHFDSASLRTIGERFAEAYLGL